MEKKKHLILLVLKLLETESDERHPITQTAIAKIISEVYHCDRKTVGRNIKFLIDVGYPIVKTNRGFYIQNKAFTLDEIEYIKAAVLSSQKDEKIEKETLINKIDEYFSKKRS